MAAERRRRDGGKAGQRRRSKELEIEKRRRKATDLRVRGKSIPEIARALGCSVGTVHSDLDAVLVRTQDAADSLIRRERAASLARIDRATDALWPRIEKGDDVAIDRLVRLERQRGKLLGTEAPVRQELSGPDGAPIPIDARTALLERLAGLADRGAAGGGEGEDPPEPVG